MCPLLYDVISGGEWRKLRVLHRASGSKARQTSLPAAYQATLYYSILFLFLLLSLPLSLSVCFTLTLSLSFSLFGPCGKRIEALRFSGSTTAALSINRSTGFPHIPLRGSGFPISHQDLMMEAIQDSLWSRAKA